MRKESKKEKRTKGKRKSGNICKKVETKSKKGGVRSRAGGAGGGVIFEGKFWVLRISSEEISEADHCRTC
jgi:hypothetical protein